MLNRSKEEKDPYGFDTLKSVDDDKFFELEQIAEISDFEQPERDNRICKACGFYGCEGECEQAKKTTDAAPQKPTET